MLFRILATLPILTITWTSSIQALPCHVDDFSPSLNNLSNSASMTIDMGILGASGGTGICATMGVKSIAGLRTCALAGGVTSLAATAFVIEPAIESAIQEGVKYLGQQGADRFGDTAQEKAAIKQLVGDTANVAGLIVGAKYLHGRLSGAPGVNAKSAKAGEAKSSDLAGSKVQSEIQGISNLKISASGRTAEIQALRNERLSRSDGLAKLKARPDAQTLEISHNVGDRAAFERKLGALQDLADRGKLTKTQTVRDTDVTFQYRKDLLDRAKKDWEHANPAKHQRFKDLLDRVDADHLHELQLGGIDHRSALTMLDKPVNRSFGAQIRPQLAKMPEGTPISQVVEKAGKK